MSACRYCGNAAPDGADVCLNCRAVLENASDSQQAAINELALLSAGLKESSVSDRTKDERSGSSRAQKAPENNHRLLSYAPYREVKAAFQRGRNSPVISVRTE